MNLKKRVAILFIFGALGGALATLGTYSIIYSILNNQKIALARDKVSHLLDGMMPLLREEVISDRLYAVALRGGKFWKEHSLEGLEIGIYRTNQTPLFESNNSTLLRTVLAGSEIPKYIVEKRDIRFAGELQGLVIFAMPLELATSTDSGKYLTAAISVLFFALAALFVVIYFFTDRWIVKPAANLAFAIPGLSKYFEGQLLEPQIPYGPKNTEIDQIAIALKDFAIRFKEASDKKSQLDIVAARQASMARVAEQVAHDIRSPLSALSLLAKEISVFPEDLRVLMRSAMQRIQDIANQLCELARENNASVSHGQRRAAYLLSSALDSVVSEKRSCFRSKLGLVIDFEINSKNYGLFSKVDPIEFKRVVSNLINNASESIREDGKISVLLELKADQILIQISDTGAGIPVEILHKIQNEGGTFGKEKGSGLGLFHARRCVEMWDGALTLQSEVNVGTKVTIVLPTVVAPRWFPTSLNLNSILQVLILDDDASIHQVWDQRLKGIYTHSVLHFSSKEELLRSIEKGLHFDQNTLCLFDFELQVVLSAWIYLSLCHPV